MPGTRGVARHDLPAPHPAAAAAVQAADAARQGARRGRARRGARHADQRAFRRQLARAGVGDAARRGPLSRVGAHDVPDSRRRGRRGARATRPSHPPRIERPELLAQRPNEVYRWDISKLKGPAKWTYFYLYAILDVFSRYCVGWTVQHRESAAVAEALIAQACEQQQITRGQLTVHADRGSSMTSKPVAMLLSDLDVTNLDRAASAGSGRLAVSD